MDGETTRRSAFQLLAGALEYPRPGLAEAVRDLYPGYFAMVMATGTISITAQLLGLAWLAGLLFLLNQAVYAVLWLLTLALGLPNFLRRNQPVGLGSFSPMASSLGRRLQAG